MTEEEKKIGIEQNLISKEKNLNIIIPNITFIVEETINETN